MTGRPLSSWRSEHPASTVGACPERAFQTNPSEFIADDDKVAVLTTWSGGGEEARVVDILTYDGEGQLIHFESFGGEDMLGRPARGYRTPWAETRCQAA